MPTFRPHQDYVYHRRLQRAGLVLGMYQETTREWMLVVLVDGMRFVWPADLSYRVVSSVGSLVPS